MKTLFLSLSLFAPLVLSGCGTEVFNTRGRRVLKTYANAEIIYFRQGNTALYMRKMNHSDPTLASGTVAGTVGDAVGNALVKGVKGF